MIGRTHLHQRHAAGIPGVVALRAAILHVNVLGLGADRDAVDAENFPDLRSDHCRAFAEGAELAHEALRLGKCQGIRKEKRRNAHGNQPADRAKTIIGVERREHQMAGQRRIHGRAGRLLVTALSDENDIRIRAQQAPQAFRKIDAVENIGLRLVHPLDLIFDRIFNRVDVDVVRVDAVKQRVQRRRLAAARGTGHQHQALIPPHGLGQERGLALGQPELRQLLDAVLLVEKADRDLLEVLPAGNRRNTAVHAALAEREREPRILGVLAALAHVGVVFDQADKAGEHFLRAGVDDLEFAIDAGAEAGGVEIFFNVQIARPSGNCAVQDPVDHLLRGGVDAGGIDPLDLLHVDIDHVGDIGIRELSLVGSLRIRGHAAALAVDRAQNRFLVRVNRAEIEGIIASREPFILEREIVFLAGQEVYDLLAAIHREDPVFFEQGFRKNRLRRRVLAAEAPVARGEVVERDAEIPGQVLQRLEIHRIRRDLSAFFLHAVPHTGILKRIFLQHPVQHLPQPFIDWRRFRKPAGFGQIQRGNAETLADIVLQRLIFRAGNEDRDEEFRRDLPESRRSGIVMGADEQRSHRAQWQPGFLVVRRKGHLPENRFRARRAGRPGRIERQHLVNSGQPFKRLFLRNAICTGQQQVQFLILLRRLARNISAFLQIAAEPVPLPLRHGASSDIRIRSNPVPAWPGGNTSNIRPFHTARYELASEEMIIAISGAMQGEPGTESSRVWSAAATACSSAPSETAAMTSSALA